MRVTASEVRESVILGHRVEVYLGGAHEWLVVVDGEESLTRFTTPYAAWAAGAAESYRQGRVPARRALDD